MASKAGKNNNAEKISSTSSSSSLLSTPYVTRDPRFKAGRNLVRKGLAQEGGIDIFATLVEEVSNKYGESSIETAPAYYEYGNALLRAALRSRNNGENDTNDDETNNANNSNTSSLLKPAENIREAAAMAAEQRLMMTTTTMEVKKSDENDDDDDDMEDKKPAAVQSSNEKNDDDEKKGEEDGNDKKEQQRNDNKAKKELEESKGENGNDGGDDDNDINLALEMMENSFSLLEEYIAETEAETKAKAETKATCSSSKPYHDWVMEQMPRVLLGIGDTLSALSRHADAADAYSRALEKRQDIKNSFASSSVPSSSSSSSAKYYSVEHLKAHRHVCEATLLIAEELLACPENEDVITTETKSLIVKSSERIEYARGYYDKARDALQETLVLMGTLASKNIDLGTEKEDICFIATLVMGVGTTLAAIDENATREGPESSSPLQKKRKKSN